MSTYKNKLKILYILRILLEKSDDEHWLSVTNIIFELDKLGIKAERKSIYEDLKILQEYGIDVCRVRSKVHGYYIGERDFQLPELRLLVDAVQSAKFITPKKSKELIEKLEHLTSVNLYKRIHEQTFINDRLKCLNEEIYYNIDKIHTAIINNKKISFNYYDYNLDKQRYLRGGGKKYNISPYAMIWYDDDYYLVGNYSKYENLSHYRIDRICNVDVINEDRRDFSTVSSYKNYFNAADYAKKIYSAFPGKIEKLRIRFRSDLINAVLDRFGMDVPIIKEDNTFTIITEAVVSEGFLSWIFIFGNGAEILEPYDVREKVKQRINSIIEIYK